MPDNKSQKSDKNKSKTPQKSKRLSGYQRNKRLTPRKRKEIQDKKVVARRKRREKMSPKEREALRLQERLAKRKQRGGLSAEERQVIYQRQRKARGIKDFHKGWEKDRNFLTVDGEAIDGKYILLAASDGSSIQARPGEELKTTDCLRFLLTRGVPYLWSFAFNYDVNMILNRLGVTALTQLSWTNKAYFGQFNVQHIPGKIFRVTEHIPGSDDLTLGTKRTVTIWDVYSFVRTNFADWLEDWKLAPPEEIKIIRTMKKQRSEFNWDNIEEIRNYCFQELKYIEKGVLELMERVEKTGYHPRYWHSPASISSEVMRKKCIKSYIGKQSIKVEKIAQYAYYGGRFENRVIGELTAPLYHYDIHSAYPAALEDLPCLDCGSWHHVGKPDIDDPYTLLQVTWRGCPSRTPPDHRPPWGPFPVRLSNGSLRYPLVCDDPRWYWGFEVKAAKQLTKIKIHAACRFKPGCSDRPFAWVRNLYTQRQEMIKKGDSAEYVLKLILNATYGKLAQRPRKNGRRPTYYSPVLSGMVTARCRTQILNAIALDPEAILQIATDGLTSTRRLDLPLSDNLGDWSMTHLHSLLLMQSGVYFWRDKKGKRMQRSRGFHPASMTYRRCINHWRKYPNEPMQFKTDRFLGYRVALQRNRLEDWRTWPTFGVAISLAPEPRREFASQENGYIISAPSIRAEAWLFDQLNLPAFTYEWAHDDQPDGPSGDGSI